MDYNALVPGFDDLLVAYLVMETKELPGVPKGIQLILRGELNTQNAPQFQRKVELAMLAGFVNLFFDCSSLNYMSSNGVGTFAFLLKQVKLKGGRLVLFQVQPKVYEVLQLLGFSSFLQCETNRNEAETYLRGERLPVPKLSEKPKPLQTPIFPRAFKCPACGASLRAPHAGKFRCSKCKWIIEVSTSGKVFAL
jgi:anti-anti-sigma factor